jgi:hypothetical protein
MKAPFFVSATAGKADLSPAGAGSSIGVHLTPLAELKHFFTGWIADLRGRRDYRNLVEAEAALDIARDLEARDATVSNVAYSAEQADLEAQAILATVLKDRVVTAAEIPLLEKALRHITRSAAADHQIGEGLAL